MGRIKRLFGLDKQDTEKAKDNDTPQVEVGPIQPLSSLGLCDSCGEDIYEYQRIRKVGGKKFHKQCLKELKKIVMNGQNPFQENNGS